MSGAEIDAMTGETVFVTETFVFSFVINHAFAKPAAAFNYRAVVTRCDLAVTFRQNTSPTAGRFAPL
ncbi:hypothetical protein AB0F96_26990 [Streptomyces sp. NPDC023998]|uniref:hypothetical protein n=1 Tax=Streptomyces sp. NPDC023998 TaxID=3154597 RepID=UPI0033F2204B